MGGVSFESPQNGAALGFLLKPTKNRCSKKTHPHHCLQAEQGSLHEKHLNIATCKWWCPLILVEKATCFKCLQDEFLLRSPAEDTCNLLVEGPTARAPTATPDDRFLHHGSWSRNKKYHQVTAGFLVLPSHFPGLRWAT